MIKLEHINEKSFNDFSLDNSKGIIKQANIIFGRNGSGKSALSNHLQAEYSEGVRVFDSDYVDNNLKARETVEGTNLIIGAEQVDLSKEIDVTRKIIQNLDSSENETKDLISNEKKRLNQQMKTLIQLGKKKFKTSRTIKQKANASVDPLKAIDLWKADVTAYGDTPHDYSSSDDLDKELAFIRAQKQLLTPILADFDDEQKRKLEKGLKTVVLVPQSAITDTVVSWLNQGLQIHNLTEESEQFPDTMTCIFCGNSFDTKSTFEDIQKKINSDHAKLLKSISRLKQKIVDAEANINSLGDSISEKYKKQALLTLKKIMEILNQKEQKPEAKFALNLDVFNALDTINEIISKELLRLSNQEKILMEEQVNIEKLVKCKIGELISQDGVVQEHSRKLIFLEKKLENDNYANKLSREYLQKIINRTNNLQGFMTMVNQTLYSLGLGFQLVFSKVDRNSFDVQLTDKNKEEIQLLSLSEGEMRLIAFIKFYFSLFSKYRPAKENQKAEKEFDSSIDLIILDDPITSIDSNNRYFMTTLINRLLSESIRPGIDMVILTHSIYDFHSFGYAMMSHVGHFRIIKNEFSDSQIEHIESEQLKNYSDDYRATFSEIVKFCYMNSKSLPNTQQYLRYGNQCRFLLETHARSNYTIENVTNGSFDKIMSAYGVKAVFGDRISQMLDTINALSHGISYTWDFVDNISASEIQRAARIMIWMLYKKDEQHVEAMVGKDGWREFKHKVQNWQLD